jgi:hypothetical protein
MPVVLPASPSPSSMTMTLVSNSIDMKPTLGGPTQRATRLGSRWQCEVTLPPMNYVAALEWMAGLSQASSQVMQLNLPQPDLLGLSAGSLVINGANQAGTSLAVSGGTPGYTFRAGQFISIFDTTGGKLYQLTAGYTLSGAGAGILPIFPQLRASPTSGSFVFEDPPIIQGFLTNMSPSWSVDAARTVALTFSILEVA